mgnify:CR=1 FL=1
MKRILLLFFFLVAAIGVNAQDKNGYTALMQVLRLNNLSEKKAFIKTLIDNGADLTKLKNIQGKTALDIMIERI